MLLFFRVDMLVWISVPVLCPTCSSHLLPIRQIHVWILLPTLGPPCSYHLLPLRLHTPATNPPQSMPALRMLQPSCSCSASHTAWLQQPAAAGGGVA